MHFDLKITINRPIDEVFRYAADVEHVPSWAKPALTREKLTEGPVSVGTRYRAVDQMPGRRLEFIEEVTVYEPNERASFALGEPINGEIDARFQPLEDGTSVNFSVALKPTGLMGLLDPVLARPMRRMFEKDLANLKATIEAN